jgi:hypothetical protein
MAKAAEKPVARGESGPGLAFAGVTTAPQTSGQLVHDVIGDINGLLRAIGLDDVLPAHGSLLGGVHAGSCDDPQDTLDMPA